MLTPIQPSSRIRILSSPAWTLPCSWWRRSPMTSSSTRPRRLSAARLRRLLAHALVQIGPEKSSRGRQAVTSG